MAHLILGFFPAHRGALRHGTHPRGTVKPEGTRTKGHQLKIVVDFTKKLGKFMDLRGFQWILQNCILVIDNGFEWISMDFNGFYQPKRRIFQQLTCLFNSWDSLQYYVYIYII